MNHLLAIGKSYDQFQRVKRSWCERFDDQTLHGSEVLDVGREHGKLMLDGGCCDKCITHLQAVTQGKRFHQFGGAVRDGLCDRQQPRSALVKHLLHGHKLGLVAHALQHFQPTDGLHCERAQFIESTRGARVAP